MDSSRLLDRAAFALTFGSVAAVLVSIAVAHILLALALAALLLSGQKLRLPPIKLPLALFLVGTILSMAVSENPALGSPQIRKFFVFLVLLCVFSTFRSVAQVRWVTLTWAGLAALSSAFAVAQFFRKMDAAQAAGRPFYEHYISERISGFMSHWMTFGGQMLIVLALLTALLMFSQAGRRYTMYGLVCAALISVGQLIGYTRSIWLATAAAVVYLVWYWRRKLLWGLPVVILVGVLMAPDSVKARLRSAVRPHGEVDSNQHRVVTWRTGWQMVKAHPWFGLGPEIVKLRFKDYVPADIPQPLPDGWYGHLHNIYLHYAAERGIPTMLALMWLLGKMLLDFVCGLRRLPPGSSDARFVLHGCVAVLIGILVTGIFELNLGDSEVLHMFLSTAAFGYVAKESAGV